MVSILTAGKPFADFDLVSIGDVIRLATADEQRRPVKWMSRV